MAPAPKPVEAAPAAESEVKEEPKHDSVYRPEVSQLDGPKILGTMDVSNMIPGGKHKRKRLEKEKVNVAKEGKNAGKQERNNKGGNNNNQQPNKPNNNSLITSIIFQLLAALSIAVLSLSSCLL